MMAPETSSDTGSPTPLTHRLLSGHRRLLSALLGYIALRVIVPYVPGPPSIVLAVIATLTFVVLGLYIAARLGYALTSGRARALVLLGALAVVLACDSASRHLGPGVWIGVLLGDAAMMIAAAAAGALLSGLAREANFIPALVVTVAVVDVVGVYAGGPVQTLLESNPELVAQLSQKIPAIGSAVYPAEMGQPPVIQYVVTAGNGDFLFVAFFFACAARFDFAFRRTLIVTLVAGAVAMLLVVGGVFSVPALPFLALGSLCCNLSAFRYTRSEKIALAWGALFLAALLALIVGMTAWLKPAGAGGDIPSKIDSGREERATL